MGGSELSNDAIGRTNSVTCSTFIYRTDKHIPPRMKCLRVQ
jgi:hypothetical protein